MPEPLPVWEFKFCPIDYATWYSLFLHDRNTGLSEDDERRWNSAEYDLWTKYGIIDSHRHPVLPIGPPLLLRLPDFDRFDLDYFCHHTIHFCSARFRAALALPPEVVQYLPVTVQTSASRLQAMDYQIMRVLPIQPAIDPERSEGPFDVRNDKWVGGPAVWMGHTRRHRLRAGLQPKTEMFCAEEAPLNIYATDSLAERVMQAGCLGMEFADPESVCLERQVLIRTATGAALSSPATRRAHRRLVKRKRAIPF
jgi:hypothetical protein